MPFASLVARRDYHREYYRPYVKARWARFRAAGGCGSCGQPVERFTQCNRCRARLAAYKRRARRRIRS